MPFSDIMAMLNVSARIGLLRLTGTPIPVLAGSKNGNVSAELPRSQGTSLKVTYGPRSGIAIIDMLRLSCTFLFDIIAMLNVAATSGPSRSLGTRAPVLAGSRNGNASTELPRC